MLVIVFLFRLLPPKHTKVKLEASLCDNNTPTTQHTHSVTRFLLARLPSCVGKLAKLQFSMVLQQRDTHVSQLIVQLVDAKPSSGPRTVGRLWSARSRWAATRDPNWSRSCDHQNSQPSHSRASATEDPTHSCSSTVAVENVSSSKLTDLSDPFCTFVSSKPVI